MEVNIQGVKSNTREGFNRFYQDLSNSFKEGVEMIDDTSIILNNNYLQGRIEFFLLDGNIALYKFDLTCKKRVILKIAATDKIETYTFLFSVKETPDLHQFSFDVAEEDTIKLGLGSKRSAFYSSSNVNSSLSISPDAVNRTVFVIIPVEEVDKRSFLYSAENGEISSGLFTGEQIKGYATMDAQMIETIYSIFECNYSHVVKILYLQGVVYQLLAMLLYEIEQQNARLIKEAGVIESARMMQIKKLLISDFNRPCPHIEEMAKIACMSVSKFQSLFKKLFEMTYYQYYQHHRLMAAKKLLSMGASVKDTAEAVGFANGAQFTTAFKKRFLVSPTDIE